MIEKEHTCAGTSHFREGSSGVGGLSAGSRALCLGALSLRAFVFRALAGARDTLLEGSEGWAVNDDLRSE